jgi:hypothetical protein
VRQPSSYTEIVLNRPGAGWLEAREVLGTYAHDHDLGPWQAGQWHSVAIEVARDCIRCLASDDGKQFNLNSAVELTAKNAKKDSYEWIA